MRMSIKEEWAARREGKIFCIETECSAVPMLRVCPWQAAEWMLPWSRFDIATFQHEEESERIEMFFSHHRVIAVGKNLKDTMNDIRAFEVRCMRDVPANLRAAVDPTEPLIEKLEVRPLNEPKKVGQGGLPF